MLLEDATSDHRCGILVALLAQVASHFEEVTKDVGMD
jgi:hypothetical protein